MMTHMCRQMLDFGSAIKNKLCLCRINGLAIEFR